MSDVNSDAVAWLERFAGRLGLAAPTTAEIENLLALAGEAAHSSHRQAAPVACWLAARAGLDPAAALEVARSLDA
ncbi:MAG: hypothetical protein RL219_2494 [Actinomycetota bacterium]|jgi:hypothetical protein